MSSPSTTKQLDKQLGEAPKTAISTPADNKLLLQAQEKFENLSIGPEAKGKQIHLEVINELHKAQLEDAPKTAISTPDNKRLLQAQKVETLSNRLVAAEAKEKQFHLQIEYYKEIAQRYKNTSTEKDKRIEELSESLKYLEYLQEKNCKDFEKTRSESGEREKLLRSIVQNQGDQLSKIREENRQVTNENSGLRTSLVQQNNWLEIEKQLLERNRPIFPCWKNCVSACLLHVCRSKGLPYLCIDLLSKFAVSLFWKICLDNNDTWDEDVVKCAKTLVLFEKSRLVHEVVIEYHIASLCEYEEYLKQTFRDDAVILACSGNGVAVGHCIVFDNTKESSKFVDVQQTNEKLTVEYLKGATSVQIYKVNIDIINNMLQAYDASDPNGHLTCHVADPMPLL